MPKNSKIAARQFMILVILFTMGNSILFVPRFFVEQAKQDAWISCIILVGCGLLLIWLYKTLGSLYPDKTLVEYSQEILGKWLGKSVSLLFFIYTFILCALLLRQISDFFRSTSMPETPIEPIHFLFLTIVILGVRYGVENIARTAEIFLPWVCFLIIIIVSLASPQIEIENLQPILAKGFKPVLEGVFMNMGFPFLELVLFLMIFPFVNRTKDGGRSFFIGHLIGGLVLVLISLLDLSVLGADEAANEQFPSFTLAQRIQRIETIMAGVWIFTIFFKLQITYYVSSLVLAQTLKMSDYRKLTFPLGMILLVLTLVIAPDTIEFTEFVTEIWTPFSLVFGLFMPVCLLVIAKIKKRKRNIIPT